MSHLEARIGLQRSRFVLIEDAANFEEDDDTQPTYQLVKTRLEMLEHNWTKFQYKHENLCQAESEAISGQPYLRERLYERCQAFYIYSRAKLLARQDDLDTTEQRSQATPSERGSVPTTMPRSSLPRIHLPTFTGDYSLWRSFRDLFVSLIWDNPESAVVEKMHFLKTSVSGEASRFISNLPVTNNNFEAAWALLVKRYDNKRLLISAQLDRIYKLKTLKFKSAQGLKALLTTALESISALRALGCAVDQWDPPLLHHLTRLLDPDTREAWEVNIGSTSSYPTFAKFEEFLTARSNGLENLSPERTTERSSTNKSRQLIAAHLATKSFEPTTLPCPLCSFLHHLAKCSSYLSKPTPQRKTIIIRHKRCFNCLGPHMVSKCPSQRRCLKCGSQHHTTIHERSSSGNVLSELNTTLNKSPSPETTPSSTTTVA